MIVTFKSKASADIIYFKDIALQLLRMMGRDDKVPSALYAEDVASALQQLQDNLARGAGGNQSATSDNSDSPAERVSISVRAQPLLEVLKKSLKKNCPVHWE